MGARKNGTGDGDTLKCTVPSCAGRLFSHYVMAAVMVSQNNETAAMLVFQTNPVGVALFS